jgi:molybdate transport system substrate-binding protein
VKKGALAVAISLLAACGGQATPAMERPVDVFAAASLTAAFTALAHSFESSHSDVSLRFNFAGSSTLVQQIEEGASANIFASADSANMQKLVDAGDVDRPAVFARNKLAIAVQKGNPKRITGLADLARPDVILVLAAPGVPAGTYATQALQKAHVNVAPKSQEQDVKAVVSKVALGEADAGIVYMTDVTAASATIEAVSIPDAQNVVATYPIALVKGRDNSTAQAFQRFVLSADGRRVLAGYGFLAP